ncbi:MAG: XdhC family protein [Spirochaetales bacterium]|nr:XdhC family protein [Spirochaetales bacterium]
MKKIIEKLLERCREGKNSILVTVISNNGSTPRNAGACMIVTKKGLLTGTIGGGMLEYKATEIAIKKLSEKKGELIKYRLTKEETASLGMICGGNVDVLFTFIQSSPQTLETLTSSYNSLNNYTEGNLLLYHDGERIDFSKKVTQTDTKSNYFIQSLTNSSRVFIFGGGHLAQELVPLLSHLNFRCIVIDDRKDFTTKELFPDAEEIYTMNFSDLKDKIKILQQDYIIAITRGHTGDYEVLKFALTTSAFYIGAVGSHSKVKAVNEKLRANNFTNEDLKRITSPIGIDIKSETPAEIAVSIAAQLIEQRAILKKDKRASKP